MLAFSEDPKFEIARLRMVEEQLRDRGIRDRAVLDAMAHVPRHEFIEPRYWSHAYGDFPVPIENDQSVSQPYMVASMLQALRLTPECKVLEVGTGTGYQAALLAAIARHVVSVERIESLATAARNNLRRLGVENIEVIIGDGSLGYPDGAPYDRIIVAAAAPAIPHTLVHQLTDGGLLLVPLGDKDTQVVHRITRNGVDTHTERLESCRFVPLIGEQGFRAE